MPFPVAHSHPQNASEPSALTKPVTRQDVLWDRPIFRAPPLAERPKSLDPTSLASDLRRVGLTPR